MANESNVNQDEKHFLYAETLGVIMKEKIKRHRPWWKADDLARNLTIQIYKNLPHVDRVDNTGFDLLSIKDSEERINDYLENRHKKKANIFVVSDNEERILEYGLTKFKVDNYLNGRTEVPLRATISFCQIFEVSLDSFIAEVHTRMSLDYIKFSSLRKDSSRGIYRNFCNEFLGDDQNRFYVYDTESQAHLFSSLFTENRDRVDIHFVYLPMIPGLKDNTTQEEVLFQRGKLIFKKDSGMCHVTSELEINSQGEKTSYEGFAVVLNPGTISATCACFIKETSNDFGIFIVVFFRLTALDKSPRKIRTGECMSTRKSDGRPFVYRLLLSENEIDDENMKFFIGHLKLNMRQNIQDGKDLHILISDKYIQAAKNYFNGNNDIADALYKDLTQFFTDVDKSSLSLVMNKFESQAIKETNNVCIINPTFFNYNDKHQVLLLGWLRKHGLAARHECLSDALDDNVDVIHKQLYPDIYANKSEDDVIY